MDQLMAIFCDRDDFCTAFAPVYDRCLLHPGQRQRPRQPTLALSEMLTLLVYCHWSHYRTFQHDSTAYVLVPLRPYFPHLVGYHRFVELMPRALVPLCCSLSPRKGRRTGMACIDSTPLAVCDHHRMAMHQVFAGRAARGQTSMGWCDGFKWPLIVNDEGALLALRLTPGNLDDRQPVGRLAAGRGGHLWGDRGSLSQALHDGLLRHGLARLTNIGRNMKTRVMRLWDTWLLRKRALIETINDQLKNSSQIAHPRHRRVTSFMVNLGAGLIA
jgi:DDE family transposase